MRDRGEEQTRWEMAETALSVSRPINLYTNNVSEFENSLYYQTKYVVFLTQKNKKKDWFEIQKRMSKTF